MSARILLAHRAATTEEGVQLGVSEVMFYSWNKEYCGVNGNQIYRIKNNIEHL